jgi:hypothetical protein
MPYIPHDRIHPSLWAAPQCGFWHGTELGQCIAMKHLMANLDKFNHGIPFRLSA